MHFARGRLWTKTILKLFKAHTDTDPSVEANLPITIFYSYTHVPIDPNIKKSIVIFNHLG